MQKNKLPIFEIVSLVIGEALVSLIIGLIYFFIGKFDSTVIFGATLGSGLTIINFFVLIISTNRAIDRALADRGDAEMDEEEVKQFAAKHQARLQLAVTVSFILRMASLVAALVLAFVLNDVFNVIATVVPLVMFRPILTVSQLLFKRRVKNVG